MIAVVLIIMLACNYGELKIGLPIEICYIYVTKKHTDCTLENELRLFFSYYIR